ncbi:hypothetical protein DBR32_04925 [Taibaiella sp. KBW10]|uniref:c-type cytochrome n=1 Tax=Taibaiella sp. KBW10 TaxID=2153357 RepID=UPI000F5A813A|nr:c-type cytochrome [Taibaiella sp. KBW10]RQO31309.1 hypothetical protein DBR32_04925 [Taibaiella sp. KBW10]
MKNAFLWGLGLATVVILNLSFIQDQKRHTFLDKQYYDVACNCVVSESFYDGKRIRYEQYTDSFNYIKNGPSLHFYENGDTVNALLYKDGLEEGDYRAKYANGKLYISGYYRGGRPVGVWKTYSEQGALTEETVYETDALRHKRVRYYDQTGDTLLYTETYQDDALMQKTVNNQGAYDRMIWAKENRTGVQIFQANCASCHHPYNDATGPKLKGVMQRHSEAWIRSWIANPSRMIANGDKAAIALYHKWNKTSMTAFPYFSKKEMNSLIGYLKSLK